MNEKMNQALNEISDTYLNEADQYQKRRFPWWIGAIAAVLAILISVFAIPHGNVNPTQPDLGVPGTGTQPVVTGPVTPPTIGNTGWIDFSALQELPDLLAAPILPKLEPFPVLDDYGGDYNAYNEAHARWFYSQRQQFDQPAGYADSLTDFFRRSIKEFLSGEENGAYSPVNVYLAMAMLAETTGGNSRQEILGLFGVSDIEALRTQASHVWNAHYNNDGQTTLLLGNSLWLDDACGFRQDTVDRLATDYYASVFCGDLGSDASNQQLQTWLNTMTGGLLEELSKGVELSKDAVFALASTVYFKAGWEDEFNTAKTVDAVFHAPNGPITTAFMNQSKEGIFYRGSNFGAVRLALTGDNSMWIILPDEGITVAEILAGEEYLTLTLDPRGWSDQTACILNISLPKFDISSQGDLCEGMQNLGLHDIFDKTVSDFTPMVSNLDGAVYVGQMDHAVRVVIDEEGVAAAAYTVIGIDGDAAPPDLVIDFTADRPFAFLVSGQSNLPLFAGVVAQP